MLKINNQQTIPFDPETDVGYALAYDDRLWYFGGGGITEFTGGFPHPFSLDKSHIKSIYGPFTRFQGTAEIGND